MADWAYYTSHPSSWVKMKASDSAQLEAAFGDPARKWLEYQDSEGRRWRVEFQRMERRCASSGAVTEICRLEFPPPDGAAWEWCALEENARYGSWQRFDPYMEGQLAAAQAVGRRSTTIYVLSFGQATPCVVQWTSCAGGGEGTLLPCRDVNLDTLVRWGCPRRETLHFRAEALDEAQIARLTGWRVLLPSEWQLGADDPILRTPLGEDGEVVVRLPCHSTAISCTFNISSIVKAMQCRPVCPSCSQAYPLPGGQPTGTMEFHSDRDSCSGHSPAPTIAISYNFRDGMQGTGHPSPGTPYIGTRRTCYYPDSPLGWSCVHLLRLAFERGQLFRIGTSVTTGQNNVVVWGGMHQKTAKHGGPAAHGWPDDTHLQRLQSEAACKGIFLPA